MRAKTKTKAKGKKKKTIGRTVVRLIFLILLGFLLWKGWDYTKPKNFPIENVKVFATYKHVEEKQLQKTVSPYLCNGFFYLNVIGLKKQLLKFPWIYAVSIKRQWPDTVLINIVEQRAILQWGENSLISSFGTIFSPVKPTFPKDLSVIFGPQDSEKELYILYKKMQRSLEPLDLTIKRLLLNPRHYWEIMLSNDVIIYLKEEDPLSQLELLINVYRKITASHKEPPKSLDMRYQSGLAVKW